ncbi:2-hydroxyacid dehydrogenase [Aureimonas leprariae]|uniref:Glyoxylate/hydroxypyruvate reductase A n=1 Tax=Plantimonas leprariae TaxID=2615207 RepID=A0A7V7PQ50_9HYPH|nr:glyoxylate/hydroxypyruvate reductase A [Aureimonas leprariae]KAB0680227.1 glyoxylate/hydroxypyruvate reductase A [Aureimonas leprariae]
MKRLFIASNDAARIAELFRSELPGHEVLTEPLEGGPPVSYAVVGRPQPGVLAGLPDLELVLSLWAGIEHLLALREIPDHVPIVRLVDEGLAGGMADWVLAHALAWHRNLGLYRDFQAKREWSPQQEKLARERIVAILGAGALGTPVAEHFVRFGFQTRVWSRSGRAVAGAQSFAGREGLPRAAADADILVNLLPLTPETTDIVDARLLAALADGAFFINGARGRHVVDADLLAALDAGHLSGAALDVFRTEPLPADDPLWQHPKVIVSPHVAAPTHPAVAVKEVAESIRRFERGQPLPNTVDRSLGY